MILRLKKPVQENYHIPSVNVAELAGEGRGEAKMSLESGNLLFMLNSAISKQHFDLELFFHFLCY